MKHCHACARTSARACARTCTALLALALLNGPTAAAQWSIAAAISAPRFFGGAAEPATGRSLRPYRPTVFEIGLDRDGRRAGVGLRLHYASSSLALEGDDALAAVKDALTVYGAEPHATIRLTPIGPDGVLRLSGGPLLELWKLPDTDYRLRVGVATSLELAVPFGGRWTGVARLGAAVTPASPFTREDLDPSLEPRALWRREVAAALRYRL